MRKYLFVFSGYLLFFSYTLQSCMCSCNCSKEMGCKIITVKSNLNNRILLTKRICSLTNFALEVAISDSVNAISKRYQTDSTSVFVIDSVYSKESKLNLKCNETSFYEKNNFYCQCAK